MIIRLPSSLSRGALLVIALVSFGGLSFLSIRNAWATYERELGTRAGLERAVKLAPGDTRNLLSLGRYLQYNLEDQDLERAIQEYHKALAIEPNSANTLLELAIAYELKQDDKDARETYAKARTAYPASPVVSWRYGNLLLRQGEYALAYQEIRHAVLVDPSLTTEAFSSCYHVHPDVDFILREVLPPSGNGYNGIVRDLAKTQTDIARTVWAKLVALHPHLEPEDVYPLVDALMDQNEYSQARLIWEQGMSLTDMHPLNSPGGSILWDGGFESGYNGRRFAWQFYPLYEGVQTSFDSREKHSGNRSLKLGFNGEWNVNYARACTYAVVEPRSKYHFSGWIQTKMLTSDHGIGFRLSAPGTDFVKTVDVRGTKPWTLVETEWQASDNVQLLQICVNRDPSSTEGRIRGTAWVDDVSLVPLAAQSARP